MEAEVRRHAVLCVDDEPLVVDGLAVAHMRGSRLMAETFGVPIVFDAALAPGYVSGIFMETHLNPVVARCDGPTMVPFKDLRSLLPQMKAMHGLVRQL